MTNINIIKIIIININIIASTNNDMSTYTYNIDPFYILASNPLYISTLPTHKKHYHLHQHCHYKDNKNIYISTSTCKLHPAYMHTSIYMPAPNSIYMPTSISPTCVNPLHQFHQVYMTTSTSSPIYHTSTKSITTNPESIIHPLSNPTKTSRRSRQLEQRWNKKRIATLSKPLRLMKRWNSKIYRHLLSKHKKECYLKHGLTVDTTLPLLKNVETCLSNMPLKKYYNNVIKNNYHNLCLPTFTPPKGIKKLLGLGLKFCVQDRRVNPLNFTTTMERLRRDVRLKFYFENNDVSGKEDDSKTPPALKKLYIKSTWNPPPAFSFVEKRLTNFEKNKRL